MLLAALQKHKQHKWGHKLRLTLMREWKTFCAPDFAAMKAALNTPLIFDGRNLYEPDVMAENGFRYFPIGRMQVI